VDEIVLSLYAMGLTITRAEADVATDNLASGRLAQKAGFHGRELLMDWAWLAASS